MRLPLQSELGKIDKVNVPSAAIHISGKLTGFQRKAWMCFFAVTRNSPDEATQRCLVRDLVKKTGYGSTNLKRLREDLKPLTVTPVSWDIFDKEVTTRMGDSQMIADIEFIPGSGIVEWSLSPKLKRLLLEELKMYLQVNFTILPDLRGHEVAIYLNVNDYINKKTNIGKKYVTVEKARDMLGLDEDEYPNPGDLYILLKRNIKKVNEKSDIDVAVKPERGARNKIIGFNFSGTVKAEYLDFYQSTFKSLSSPEKSQENAPDSFLYHLSTEVKEKLDSWDFVFYPDVLAALEKLLQEPYSFDSSAIDAYLLYLVGKGEKQVQKNEVQGIKGNPGGLLKRFITSAQHLDAFIHKSKEQKKAAEKSENARVSLSELVNQELKEEYNKAEKKRFWAFLSERFEDFELKISTLVKEHGNSLTTQIINKKHAGVMTREAIDNPTIFPILYGFAGDFGYQAEEYTTWREQFLGNPKHALTVENIKYKAEKALKEKFGTAAKRA